MNGHIDRSIVLGNDDHGKCIVTASPTRIDGARRNYRINWRVLNFCSREAIVSVGNFKLEDRGGGLKEPLVFKEFPRVAPNSQGQIRGRVKDDLTEDDFGAYKYDILVDGAVIEDPMLVIDGP